MSLTENEMLDLLNFLERTEYHSKWNNRQTLAGNVLGGARVRVISRADSPKLAAAKLNAFNLHVEVEGFGRTVSAKDFLEGNF